MKRHLLGALLLLGLFIAACTPGGGAGTPSATAVDNSTPTAGDNSTPAAADPYDY